MNQVVYGFHTLQQRFGETVTAVGEDVVNDAITQAMAEHNRQMDAFTRLFVRGGITDPTRTFRVGTVTRNQPLDEAGRPLPIRGEARYSVGFPLQMSGNAIGRTWLEAQKSRVEDVNRIVAAIIDGDRSWVFDHILAALFNNVDRQFFDPEKGEITVKPIANGDSTVYQVPNGAFAGSTDNHLLAQAATIADASNPFPAIYQELAEHPENGGIGRVVAFIPSGLKSDVQALGTFYNPQNPDLTPGNANTVLSGALGVNVPGTVLGMEESGVWAVEWPRMPSNYIVAIATGGEPPIGERVDPDAGLRGFIEIDGNEDFPWYQRNWMRMAGYGAWNRVSAVVMRIGNGSYAVPTGYATVMP
jgi:hypothetical protein